MKEFSFIALKHMSTQTNPCVVITARIGMPTETMTGMPGTDAIEVLEEKRGQVGENSEEKGSSKKGSGGDDSDGKGSDGDGDDSDGERIEMFFSTEDFDNAKKHTIVAKEIRDQLENIHVRGMQRQGNLEDDKRLFHNLLIQLGETISTGEHKADPEVQQLLRAFMTPEVFPSLHFLLADANEVGKQLFINFTMQHFPVHPKHTQIIHNLFLGDVRAIWCQEIKAELVINCTPELPFNISAGYPRIQCRVPLEDNLSLSSARKMLRQLPNLVATIDIHMTNGKQVLVHCMAGMQRSACVVAAYLMAYRRFSLQEVESFLKSLRSCVFTPYMNFFYTLLEWEKILQVPHSTKKSFHDHLTEQTQIRLKMSLESTIINEPRLLTFPVYQNEITILLEDAEERAMQKEIREILDTEL